MSHTSTVPLWSMMREIDIRLGARPAPTLLAVSQIHGVVRRSLLTDKEPTAVDLSKYKLVDPDDLVLNRFNAYRGALGRAREHGIVSPDYAVFRATDASPAYLEYLMRADVVSSFMVETMGGIGAMDPNSSGFARVDLREIERLRVDRRSLQEQDAIAAHIDSEVAEIDAFVADQEQLIALLGERRTAMISHAVSRGLDSSVPTTASEIPSIGRVPHGWTVTPFRFAAHYREGPGIGAADFHEEGVPLLRVAGVRGRYATLDGANFLDPELVATKWHHFRVRRGDLLISASASTGTICEAGEDVVGAIPYTGIIILRPTALVTRDYLRWSLQGSAFLTQIDEQKAGSTIQHYGPTHLRQMRLVLPSVAEQVKIAAHLDRETTEIDAATADARHAIALSMERRAALISAAVTGQIDVTARVEASV